MELARQVAGVGRRLRGATGAFLLRFERRMDPRADNWCCARRRELAQQVAGVARKLRAATGLRAACVHGGANRTPQVRFHRDSKLQ